MRIGRKMQAAQDFVAANPGCTKQEVSLAVGPNGSNAYGYAIVQRAIKAGLIEAAQGRRGYSLTAR